MPHRMPAVFFGHGNPMKALLRNPYTERWAAIGASLPPPKAVPLRVGALVHLGRRRDGEHRSENNPRLRRVPAGTVSGAVPSAGRPGPAEIPLFTTSNS